MYWHEVVLLLAFVLNVQKFDKVRLRASFSFSVRKPVMKATTIYSPKAFSGA